MDTRSLPLFEHALESPSAFTPDRPIAAVRTERTLASEAVPPLCVFDFDGDPSDHFAAQGIALITRTTDDQGRSQFASADPDCPRQMVQRSQNLEEYLR